jgi:hypothetical protein
MANIRIIIKFDAEALMKDIASLLPHVLGLKRRLMRLNARTERNTKRQKGIGEMQPKTPSPDIDVEDMIQQYCLNCAKELAMTSRSASASTVKKYCNSKCRSAYHNKLRKS